jgi:hypothetical protein
MSWRRKLKLIEKKPMGNVNWDTKTLVDGELESRAQTRIDGKFIVPGKLPSLLS